MKINVNKNKLQAKRRKKKALRINNKKLPVKVYISLALGILSFVSLVTVCIISAVYKGEADANIGIIPLIAVVCNIIGLVLAYRCLKTDDIHDKRISVANIINCTLIIIYMLLYIIGMI